MKASWVAVAAVLAACGAEGEAIDPGTDAGTGGSGGGGPIVHQHSVPLMWSGQGDAPKIALVWQTLLDLDFDFDEQLLPVAASDLAALPGGGIEIPSADRLVHDFDFPYRYAQAMILAVDDVDGDGAIVWDGFEVLEPDVLVGVAPHHMLFYTLADPDADVASPVADGLHLGTLDFCGSGAVLEVALSTPIQLLPIEPGLSAEDMLGEPCADFGPQVAAGSGEGPCTADVASEACSSCSADVLDACRETTCSELAMPLTTCAADAGCIDDAGAWDASCVSDGCGDAFRAYDDCLYTCWNPYACF